MYNKLKIVKIKLYLEIYCRLSQNNALFLLNKIFKIVLITLNHFKKNIFLIKSNIFLKIVLVSVKIFAKKFRHSINYITY